MLDVRRLAVLETVVRLRSFTAAAQSLNYTQSAVSQQIAALERECGVQLLSRRGRKLAPTAAGEVLLRHARTILAATADAEAELEALCELRAGEVRIAAAPAAGAAALVPLAAAHFRRRYPDVALSLTGEDQDSALSGLTSGAYDLVLVVGRGESPPDESDATERTWLLDDQFAVVLPAAHSRAHEESVTLEWLREETWIATSPVGHPDAAVLVAACERAGFSPQTAFHVQDHGIVQGFIAAGVGVAMLPRLSLVALCDGVVVLPLRPPVTRRIEAVVQRTRQQSPAVIAALDALQDAAKELSSRSTM